MRGSNLFKYLILKKQTPISELVKDPEWQKVRERLLGQWKTRPIWCCDELKKFLGKIEKTSNDKIRIVMNYLTGSGFRMGKIKHECIQDLRDSLSKEIKIRKESKRWGN